MSNALPTARLHAMRVIRLNSDAPARAALEEAAELLRSGRLVAFPTETVYGLGANALDERAVRRIYEAKGRPAINPLIVHVASAAEARTFALDWTPAADTLARAFWPGPLTLVVKKTAAIPSLVSAGGATVGLRVPAHPVALALLEAAGIPIAAPSANRSNQISPTTAQHVIDALGDRVDLIIDGGATTVGIESTVVDVTGAIPRILRPGMVSLSEVAGIVAGAEVGSARPGDDALLSPGMLGKHYAPHGVVTLFEAPEAGAAAAHARAALDQGRRVGALVFSTLGVAGVHEFAMAAHPRECARTLYATLHAIDAAGCELILIESPPRTDEWAGVRDRLERAARS